MANITKRGDSFRITVSIGFNGNGKRIRYTETYTPVAKTPKAIEKEVNHYAAMLDQKAKDGRISIDGGVKFADFADTWAKDWATENLSIQQKEAYQDHLRLYVLPAIGNLKLSKIRKAHCNDIVNSMKADGKAPKTIRRIVTAMRSVFEYAVYLELLTSNPAEHLNLPKIQQDDEIHCFDLEQAQTFLNALSLKYPDHSGRRTDLKTAGSATKYVEIPYQFQVYFYLSIFGGFRRSELLALTWDDINYQYHTISINKAMASTKNGQIVKDTKTKAGRREIQLPMICFEMLAAWQDTQKELCKLSTWQGQPAKTLQKNNIFIQADGKPMHLSTPTHKFKEIITAYNAMISEQAEQAKTEAEKESILSKQLPMIRLHDLRHTSATLLISEGTDILTVSKRLGHASPSITLDVYSHALKKKDETASNTLEQLFTPKQTVRPGSDNRPELYN